MADITKDVHFQDLFKGINSKNLKIDNEIKVPNEFYQKLLDYFMERSYLNQAGE